MAQLLGTPGSRLTSSVGEKTSEWSLFGGTTVMSLLILELGVRLTAPQPPSWLDLYAEHPVLPYIVQPGFAGHIDTGDQAWSVYADDRGFRRGKLEVPPDPELPVALWLGDSFTFGFGVDHEDTFVARLDARDDRRFRHRNAAVLGYGPVEYRLMLEELLASEPAPKRLFVTTFLGNDFNDTIIDKRVPIRNGVLGDQGDPKSWLKRNSHAYRLTARLYHQKVDGSGLKKISGIERLESWQREPLKTAVGRYRESFAAIARRCADRGIELEVVLIPGSYMLAAAGGRIPASPEPGIDHLHPIHTAKHLFQELGIRTLDLTPALARHEVTEVLFKFDEHFTPFGHQVVMQAILQAHPELSAPRNAAVH